MKILMGTRINIVDIFLMLGAGTRRYLPQHITDGGVLYCYCGGGVVRVRKFLKMDRCKFNVSNHDLSH